MPTRDSSSPAALRRSVLPNVWDGLAFLLVIAGLIAVTYAVRVTNSPLSAIANTPLLDPSHLPEYALRTVLRMMLALVCSLVFTFVYATLAARSRRAELLLIPLLDILQSVPILGFLTFTVVFFLNLFPGSVFGAELASVFAIFTSQAWNMTFSMYQSLRTVPSDLEEVAQNFHLTAWQKFWRLDVPFATPGLVWNTMMSMSGGWFFVVASEAITVGSTTITLPGLGSYVAEAIRQQNLAAVGWAVVAMLFVIVGYDQLIFRPIVAWADKFRFEQTASSSAPSSWVLDLFRRARAFQRLTGPVRGILAGLASPGPARLATIPVLPRLRLALSRRAADRIWIGVLLVGAAWAGWSIWTYLSDSLRPNDLEEVAVGAAFTLCRVVVLMVIASIVWVPIGVWIGLRPKLAERVQPLAQFLAAFPANIAFPMFVVLIVRFGLNPTVWLSPLMILGTQWYILFNVIAGASAYPNDLKEAAATFHIRGPQWWLRVILPGIFPYYVTGAVTASGGSWNASIVAEVASWGDKQLTATGLGSYIAAASAAGDYHRVVLGIVVMCACVALFNRLLWRPLYQFSERRLRLA